ncbi:MAG TPA: hypothetical protein VEU08_21610 [Vicinamibacterales bacterium]|nr:hypothetical protein [Vicinamibacterales bacterium]
MHPLRLAHRRPGANWSVRGRRKDAAEDDDRLVGVAERLIDRCRRLGEPRTGPDHRRFTLLQRGDRARQRSEEARLNALRNEQRFMQRRRRKNRLGARDQVIVGRPRCPFERFNGFFEARHHPADPRDVREAAVQRPARLPAAVGRGLLFDPAPCLPPPALDDDGHGPFELRQGRSAARRRFKKGAMVVAQHENASVRRVFSASALLHIGLFVSKSVDQRVQVPFTVL